MSNWKWLVVLLVLTLTHIRAAEDASAPVLRISLSSPQDFQVAQRSTRAGGKLVIAGSIVAEPKGAELPDKLEARAVGQSPFGKLDAQWQPLPCDSRVAAFRGELNLPAGGWYRLEIRAFRKGVEVAATVVEHVGVGEVFVIAGQSNSANYGEEKQRAQTGLVAAFDGTGWQLAADPEPGAGGTKGSFMPLFGDEMAERLHVPVGIVAAGIGATSVREWLRSGTRLRGLPPLTRYVVTVGPGEWEPTGKLFSNFTDRMKQFGPNGFRAVLWHQGEADAHQADPERTLPGELYRKDLEQLIRDARQACGWDAPWFVAQATYHSPDDARSPEIRAAQKSVWDDGVALPGPDTDALTGDMRDKGGKGIHLSAKGLKVHAQLWVEKVGPWLDRQLGP